MSELISVPYPPRVSDADLEREISLCANSIHQAQTDEYREIMNRRLSIALDLRDHRRAMCMPKFVTSEYPP